MTLDTGVTIPLDQDSFHLFVLLSFLCYVKTALPLPPNTVDLGTKKQPISVVALQI